MLIEYYTVTEKIRDSLRRIDEARNVLEEHLKHPEEWHGVIKRQVMAGVVHYSTAIEGNILTRDQVESIIAGEAIDVPDKDRVEAENYYRAMRWAQTRSQDPSWRMTHETILTLHFMVCADLGKDYEPLGQYRHAQNTVQDRITGESIYWPPRPADTLPLMTEFVEWNRRSADRDTNPYIVNALAHLNFVAIHPFSDGNGRVGRLLCSLLMMREGYKAQAFWSLEQFLGENTVTYGQILALTLGPRWDPARVDASTWIEWYLEAAATQVVKASAQMSRSIAEFGAVIAGLAETQGLQKATPRAVIPVWLAIIGGSVTRRQLARYIDVSHETLTRDLRRLVSQGLLIGVGSGRGAQYRPGPEVNRWGDFAQIAAAAEAGGVQAARIVIARSRTGEVPLSPRRPSSRR